jgi:hypothetical protein
MNSINVTIINPGFMSVFIGTALSCLLIGVRALFTWNRGGAKLLFAASLVYLMGTFGVTLIFNVPLNKRASKGKHRWEFCLEEGWARGDAQKGVADGAGEVVAFVAAPREKKVSDGKAASVDGQADGVALAEVG